MKEIFFSILLFWFYKSETGISSNIYVLKKLPPISVGCGVIPVAADFLFSDVKDSALKIGTIVCPSLYAENFFVEQNKYLIEFSKDSILPKGYTLFYKITIDSMHIPTRIVTKIKKVE